MNHARVWWNILASAAMLGLWEVAAAHGWVDAQFFGRPTGVWIAAVRMMGEPSLAEAVRWTLTEFCLGLILAAAVGIPLGLLVGYSRLFGELFDPLLMALNSAPREALIPLILIWFGAGIWAKALVAFMGAVIPIAVNAAVAARNVDPAWLKAAHSFGASQRKIFWHILLPSSTPHLTAGLRLGIGRAVLGVIIAEMYAALHGVGKLIVFSAQAVKTDELLFLTFLVSLFGIAAVKATGLLEKWVAPWRQEFEI